MPAVVTEDGVRISYNVRGDGPRTLLFMHGWAGSGAFFDETLKHLDLSGLRTITYDFRGHGASDKVERGYTLDRFTADALAVMDAAGAGTAILIGYSMAGKFAQYLACVTPERVAGQILVSSAPAAELPIPDEVQRDWVDRAGDRERMDDLERRFLTKPVAPEVVGRFLDDAVKVSAYALDQTLTMCKASFADRLSGIRAPTLVIGGQHDWLIAPEVLRQGIVAPIAGARLALLDCNHDVPIEQPLEFAGLIEAFLAALR